MLLIPDDYNYLIEKSGLVSRIDIHLNGDVERYLQPEPPPLAPKIDPEVDSPLQYGHGFDGGRLICYFWYWSPVREVYPPHPLLLPSYVLTPLLSSFAFFRHCHHRIILPPGCPLSPSHYTKNPYPSLLSTITALDRLLLPSLAPAMPVGFLSPPIPCYCQNIFQRGLQLLLCSLLPPPRLAQLHPSLVSCIFFTDLKYWPKGHPLCYCRLPLVNIFPQIFSPCLLKHPYRLLLFPSLFP